jgi:hypothetical protein
MGLPNALYRTVVCVEKASPDAKVAAEYGCAGFDCCDGTDASFAIGRVAEPFDTVPYRTADCLRALSAYEESKCEQNKTITYAHGEGATKVIENHPGTRVAGMVHDDERISWATGE